MTTPLPAYPTDDEGKPLPLKTIVDKLSLEILSENMISAIGALVAAGETPAKIFSFVQRETGNDFIAALAESAATELRANARAAIRLGVDL